jgi:hypothetical protein
VEREGRGERKRGVERMGERKRGVRMGRGSGGRERRRQWKEGEERQRPCAVRIWLAVLT